MQQKATGGQQSAKEQAGAEHKAAQQAIQAFQGLDAKPLTPAAPPGPGGLTCCTNRSSTSGDSGGVATSTPSQMSADSPVVTIRRMP